MRDQNDRTSQRPADIRSISDPPDMGKLKPAEEVARGLASVGPIHGMHALTFGRADNAIVLDIAASGTHLGEIARRIHRELAAVVRQSRAEGAAAVLEALADEFDDEVGAHEGTGKRVEPHAAAAEYHYGKAEAYAAVAALLRARAKSISDPPDMG